MADECKHEYRILDQIDGGAVNAPCVLRVLCWQCGAVLQPAIRLEIGRPEPVVNCRYENNSNKG